jgi:hypothetical protein
LLHADGAAQHDVHWHREGHGAAPTAPEAQRRKAQQLRQHPRRGRRQQRWPRARIRVTAQRQARQARERGRARRGARRTCGSAQKQRRAAGARRSAVPS